MKTLTIRGIDEELGKLIKDMSRKSELSVNRWLIQMLRKITRLDKKPFIQAYHDLDKLAGNWTRKEAQAFTENTSLFEQIDEDVWK